MAIFRLRVLVELRSYYQDNLFGIVWLILEPLLLLCVYAFVFTYIFIDRGSETGVSFIAHLALAMWPWLAFSQSIAKCTTLISDLSGVFKRNNVDKRQYIIARVTATYFVNYIPYFLVLIILHFFVNELYLLNIWVLLPIILLLWMSSISIAFIISSTCVFIRDLKTIIPVILTMLFFATPIIWAGNMLPENYQFFLNINPLAISIESLRAALLFDEIKFNIQYIYIVSAVVLLYVVSNWYFQRLSPFTEEFS